MVDPHGRWSGQLDVSSTKPALLVVPGSRCPCCGGLRRRAEYNGSRTEDRGTLGRNEGLVWQMSWDLAVVVCIPVPRISGKRAADDVDLMRCGRQV